MFRTAVLSAQFLCARSGDIFFGVNASGTYRFSHVRLQRGGIESTTINVQAKPVLDASVVSS